MKILAIESSSTIASVAVAIGDRIVACEYSNKQRQHSELINPLVNFCLDQAQLKLEDIDLFASGVGPGSFTGIRVSTNIISTFSFLFKKPVVAIDSLSLLAQHSEQASLVMINAYKNMVYWAYFKNKNDKPIKLATSLKQIKFEIEKINLSGEEKIFCIGNGYDLLNEEIFPGYKQLFSRPSSCLDSPQASTLALMAEEYYKNNQSLEWNFVHPLYLRSSFAEEKA